MPMRVARVINGRRILEHDPVGQFKALWYSVELRGPLFQGHPIEAWVSFDSLLGAIAEAEQRGPMPGEPEILS
jgi:hypothetical protein